MTPDLHGEIILLLLTVIVTGVSAGLGWGMKRMICKIDNVDLLLRGDGNGNPGISEKIRDVHDEVSALGGTITHVETLAQAAMDHSVDHDKEADDWKKRIVAIEARCATVQANKLQPST